jgi:8-oxo-dGTP pyrophosphatase MutT (NUDIX family)
MVEVRMRSIGVIPVSRSETGEYLFLVVKHRAGHWSFLKGTPEEGESEIETAKRELYEETGIREVELQTDKLFTQEYSYVEDDIAKHKQVIYYVGMTSDINTETPTEFKNEIQEIRWLSYDKAHELLTYKGSKLILEEVKNYLSTTHL